MSIDSDLGYLLHDATRLLRKRVDRRMAACGLSTAQWRLLLATLRNGVVTQARLAEKLEIEPISVSRLVDRMEQAGWVAREADPADRRSKLVVPTERALAAYDGIRQIAREIYGEALSGLTPADRGQLEATLQTIITNLSNAEASDSVVPGSEAKS